MTEKRNIHALIEKEAPSLNNLLDPNDVKEFKEMTSELRDTWTKKQVFRTETEMRMSVLQDAKYPTKASKYWQCVREQNVFLENLMSLSFDARRNEVKLKKLKQKLETEEDPLKRELLQIDIDEKTYSVANMQLVAKDRMREIKLWSALKKEFNDGSFDDKDVNRHQLDSYALIMKNKAETLTTGSSQPEVFNVLGQLQTIERVKMTSEPKTNKQLFFLVAMPRSGNTVFASLMNQNPEIVCTANSITLEIMKDLYLLKKTDVFQNFPDHKSLDNVLDSVYDTYYKDWPQRIIIDRGPVMTKGNFALMQKHFKRPFKCIVLLRNLMDVLASYMQWYTKNPDSFVNRYGL